MRRKGNSWLIFGKQDLKAAHKLMEEKIYNLVCFHCQQSAEKALKAYLSIKGEEIPKEHSLVSLLSRCKKFDSTFEKLTKNCKRLDLFYIPTRYPDALPGSLPEGLPTEEHADNAIQMAEEIFNFVEKRIKKI